MVNEKGTQGTFQGGFMRPDVTVKFLTNVMLSNMVALSSSKAFGYNNAKNKLY